jgi:hypothetical protein
VSATSTAVRRRLHPGFDQLVLRVAVVVGALVSLVAAQAAGARPAPWEQASLGVLAVVLALRPESVAGVLLLAGSAYVWLQAPESLSALLLLAVAGQLTAHLAALVAAQGPILLRVDRAQVRLWLRRGVLLWLAAACVWGVALLLADAPGGRLAYAAGLTVLTAVAVLATRLIGQRR